MGQPTFEQFFSAISEQESGGNYKAVGPSVQGGHHAYGKYQVMDYNIPSWTKKYYGKSLTPQQFMNNPKAQEAVARGVLQGYYNKYGAKGAAAMWYSGQSNPNKTYGNPPVYQYVNSVINKAYKYPSEGSSSNFSTGSTATPKLSSAELAEQYGFVSSFLNSNKELKNLFQDAVAGGWSADKFQAKLRNTKWWKTHSKDEREWLLQLKADPATAKQEMSQAKVKIKQLANQMGMVMTKDIQKYLDKAAYNMVALGWDESQLRYYLGQYVSFKGETLQGEGGEAINEMREYAYSMGVKLDDTWYTDRARNILRGVATIQDYKSEIMNKAKASFPQWTKQIEAGQSVADIASPYMQSMAQILELPAGSVNLFDTTIKKALNYKNPTTLQNEAKPLWQFENELRNDPRWKKTKNAQDSLFQVGHQVLADFGFKY
ncbi:minor tail protein [Streptomyces phage Vorvolakos]|uniref:Minor tail protein n=3 Tax=Flowerpowervirus flowerpower TaxID=2846396 RepID=A0A2U8UN03_9CAUD|nr:glycosylase [Streptomyces phage FlowerPower]QEA11235.1 minor tail protein [Streptomyces phage Geostin]QFP94731.1 minor tail protein [Streptomyces phage Fabian]QZD97079.1 minor tail protein [Streptomyces phage RetrieverFever]UOW93246.1 minor tail protein [Streptomyces phage Vorvolakos]AWN05114.1 minor tail protein [Streptomyces phage FlowerPower]